MKIMIVDDHSGFRQVVRTMIQSTGAEIVECEDGAQALKQYPSCRPDLVLMDIEMRGLDGLQATARIKASFPTARILMLTQYDDPELRVAARKAGATGYLLKDNLSQLPANIQEILDANGRAD